jgi:hypothetical protein
MSSSRRVKVTLALVAPAACAALLGGCSSGVDSEESTAAIHTAVSKQIVGGTLGDCLDLAGFTVDPDAVKTGYASEGWIRVEFVDKDDPNVAVRLAVSTDTSAVMPYGSHDQEQLGKSGCALNGDVYGF